MDKKIKKWQITIDRKRTAFYLIILVLYLSYLMFQLIKIQH